MERLEPYGADMSTDEWRRRRSWRPGSALDGSVVEETLNDCVGAQAFVPGAPRGRDEVPGSRRTCRSSALTSSVWCVKVGSTETGEW
jgi:hypothetical protein